MMRNYAHSKKDAEKRRIPDAKEKEKDSGLKVSGGFLTPMIGTPVPGGFDIKKVPDGKVMMVPMDNAETNDIYTVVIVGMGALGLLFGSQIREGMDALGLTYEDQILQTVETDGAYLGRMIRQGMRESTVFFPHGRREEAAPA